MYNFHIVNCAKNTQRTPFHKHEKYIVIIYMSNLCFRQTVEGAAQPSKHRRFTFVQ